MPDMPRHAPPRPLAPSPCSVRNTLQDSNVADKIDEADKSKLENLVKETLEWLDANQVKFGRWVKRNKWPGFGVGGCTRCASASDCPAPPPFPPSPSHLQSLPLLYRVVAAGRGGGV